MDFKTFFKIAKDLPWAQLVEYGPQIAEGLQKLRKMRDEVEASARQAARAEAVRRIGPLEERLDGLERELEQLQAEHARSLAGVEVFRRRLLLVTWLAGASLVTALLALGIALFA